MAIMKIISAVRNPSGKMSLAVIDVNSGDANYLTPFSFNVIGFPYLLNDTVYFSYSYHKNDELFACTFSDKKLWRIAGMAEENVGKYQPPCIIKKKNSLERLYRRLPLKEAQEMKTVCRNKSEYFDKDTSGFGITALQKTNANLLYGVASDSFLVTKYAKGFHLFNFHSIQPNADDPEYTVSLLGENILNTFQSKLAFTYDRVEQSKKVGFSVLYGATIPIFIGGD